MSSCESTVAIVILTCDQRDLALTCLRSLYTSAGFQHIIVIDNGSRDGTADAIEGEFPSVHVIRSATNLGVAGGRNLGIQRALDLEADYVWILDNDTVVPPGAPQALLHYMSRHPDVGIAAATVCWGSEPTTIWSTSGQLQWLLGEARHPERGMPYDSLKAPESEAAFISGCNMFVRAEVFRRCGLLDERFFYGYEDVDLSLRARSIGYRLVSLRSPMILHYHQSALGTISPLKVYFGVRSRFLFMELHAPRWLWFAFCIAWLVQFLTRYAPGRFLRGDTASVRAAYWGLRDYVTRRWAYPSNLE